MASGAERSQEARESVVDPLRSDSNRRPLLTFLVMFAVIFGVGTVLIVLGAPDWLLILAGVLVGPPAVRSARWATTRANRAD